MRVRHGPLHCTAAAAIQVLVLQGDNASPARRDRVGRPRAIIGAATANKAPVASVVAAMKMATVMAANSDAIWSIEVEGLKIKLLVFQFKICMFLLYETRNWMISGPFKYPNIAFFSLKDSEHAGTNHAYYRSDLNTQS